MAVGPIERVLGQLRQRALGPPGGEATDAELLGRFLERREEVAFAALVRRHAGMVLGVCRRVAGDAHDAEDAFQAVFCLLLVKAATIRRREALGSWLYGVAYRTALAARARRARTRRREHPVDAMPQPSAPPPADAPADWQPLLDAALERLPDKYRAPIVLCDLEGKSRRDAARALGVAEGTLSSRLSRGRRLLAKRLARHGILVSGAALAALLTQEAVAAAAPAPLVHAVVGAGLKYLTSQTAAAAFAAPVVALAQGVSKAMLISKLKTLTVALVLAVAVLGGGWFAGDRGGAVFAQAAAEPGAARSLPAKNISGFSVEYTVEFIVQFEGEAKPVAMPRGTAPVGQRLSLRIQDMRTTKERLPTEVGWEVEVLRERGNDVLVAFRVEKKLRGADAIVRGQSLEFEDFVALGAWKDINDPALGMSCKLKVSPANVSAQPAPAPAVTLPPSARRPLSDPKKQTDEAASAAPAEDRVLRIFELTHERMPAFAARLKELKPGLVFAGTAGDTSGKKLGVLARAQEMEQIAALIGKLDVPAQPGAAAPPAAAPLAVAPPAAAPLAEVAASAISPDGRRMALATKDDVMLLDTQTGRLLARTTGGAGAGPVRAVAFSPDGKLIASGSHGGTVALLDSATGKVLRQAKVGRPITIVVFTPDGATLTITTTDMVQHLLDMITGTLKRGADETKPRR